jgi:hypothetical protein
MTKQTGTIITIVVAVLTLCCSLSCCGGGIATLAGGGTMTFGGETTDLPPTAGIPGICLGLLVWVVPVLLWVFLVRGKEEEGAIAEEGEVAAE